MTFRTSGFFACIFLLSLFVSCSVKQDIKSFEAMNTFMTLKSYGKNCTKANLEVQEKISQIENQISATKEQSYIYQLNNNPTTALELNPPTYELINFAQEISSRTNGALNIVLYPVSILWGFPTGQYHVPTSAEIEAILPLTNPSCVHLDSLKYSVTLESGMKMDLGAVGKGFAGDEALKVLKQNGITSALIDLGGNIQTLGSKPDGSDWSIGIKNPWDGSVAAGLKIQDKAVITSGGYERFFTGDDGNKYIHIFDGKTGRPVKNDIASVTIICPSGLYGDSLSTALFVLGLDEACKFWKAYKDFGMIIITQNNELYYTSELKITVMSDFTSVTVLQ